MTESVQCWGTNADNCRRRQLLMGTALDISRCFQSLLSHCPSEPTLLSVKSAVKWFFAEQMHENTVHLNCTGVSRAPHILLFNWNKWILTTFCAYCLETIPSFQFVRTSVLCTCPLLCFLWSLHFVSIDFSLTLAGAHQFKLSVTSPTSPYLHSLLCLL